MAFSGQQNYLYSKYLNTDCGLTKKSNIIAYHVLTSDFHTHLASC